MLTRMLEEAVAQDPSKIAIVQGSRRIRYDEFLALARRCASGLRRMGVGQGDCIAVALPNCPEFIATLFGCAMIRAIMLPLNPQYTRDELQRFVIDASARIVITDRAPLFAGTGAKIVGFDALLTEAPARRAPLVLFCFIIPALFGCKPASSDPPAKASPPINVQTALPKRGGIARTITLPTFRILAVQEANLFAKVSGYLKTLPVSYTHLTLPTNREV